MTIQPLDNPKALVQYLTDNARLQKHLIQFLSAKTELERQALDEVFWNNVETLSTSEQIILKNAKKQIAQRMVDRTSSVALFLKEESRGISVLA